jgi:hypothetical protein
MDTLEKVVDTPLGLAVAIVFVVAGGLAITTWLTSGPFPGTAAVIKNGAP